MYGDKALNSLLPSISMHIFHSVLNLFLSDDKENLIRNQELLKFAIISLILMTTFRSKTFQCSCFSNLARNYVSIFKKML